MNGPRTDELADRDRRSRRRRRILLTAGLHALLAILFLAAFLVSMWAGSGH